MTSQAKFWVTFKFWIFTNKKHSEAVNYVIKAMKKSVTKTTLFLAVVWTKLSVKQPEQQSILRSTVYSLPNTRTPQVLFNRPQEPAGRQLININFLTPSGYLTYHQVYFSKILHGARFAPSVLYGYENRQRLLLYTALTGCFLYQWKKVFTARYGLIPYLK